MAPETRYPTRWGKTDIIDKRLAEGNRGIPAIPLYRPFAGWVARGWRRTKYLRMHEAAGSPTVYFLYATGGVAPEYVFDEDVEDIMDDLQDFDAALGELARRQGDSLSMTPKQVVGVGAVEYVDCGFQAWNFCGGIVLPKPIALSELVNRPYGGVFYPFGREVK